MPCNGTRKAYTLSWGTELELGINKSNLTDDQQIESIMPYLQDKAPQSCYGTSYQSQGANMSLPFLLWITIPP
jgi:hypothetical protein